MRAKDTLKRKDTLQQKIWDYIRRNPNFRAGDILMIVPVSDRALIRYLYLLGKMNYIRRSNPKTSTIKFIDVEYSTTRNFGVTAPIVNASATEVYDPNTEETFAIVNTVVATETYRYYSRLLGLNKGFLRIYKLRYPELETPRECYEHYLEQQKIKKKLQFLFSYLVKEGLLRTFSKHLVSKNLYKSVDHFPALRVFSAWIGKASTIEKYKQIVKEFEALYGAVKTLKETL